MIKKVFVIPFEFSICQHVLVPLARNLETAKNSFMEYSVFCNRYGILIRINIAPTKIYFLATTSNQNRTLNLDL